MIDRSYVVESLEARIDRSIWGMACGGIGSYRTRSVAVGDLVGKACVNSVFGWYGDALWCFNGRVYERISMDEFRWLLDNLLLRMGADIVIRSCVEGIAKRVAVVIRLESVLRPRFDLMAFQNGVVDFRDGELREFSPMWHVMEQQEYDYDPKAECPMWHRFLRTILPERTSRLILQMFMGLLVADRREIGEPFALAEFGNCAYGKSVVNEIIRSLFGFESVSNMPLDDILSVTDAGKRARRLLVGKRVNMCTKLDENFALFHENAFWDYLAGRSVTVRYSRDMDERLDNVPWQVFNFNTMPVKGDTGSGVLRRLVFLLFGEFIPDRDANLRIGNDLRKELPGILNWCLRGKKYARLHGYRFPSSTNSERERIMTVGGRDSVAAWFMFVKPSHRARCDGDPERWVRVKHLYNHYSRFCEANGFERKSMQAFGRKLAWQGFTGPSKRRLPDGYEVRMYGFSEEEEIDGNISLSEWKVASDREFDDITEE